METLDRIDALLADYAAPYLGVDSPPESIRLNEQEVYRLCDLLGIARAGSAFLPLGADRKGWAEWAAAARRLAADHGKVLLKVVGREILHKTDVGGVRILAIEPGSDDTELFRAVTEMEEQLAAGGLADSVEGFLAGEFVPHRANQPGQELLLSLRQDPAFGPCVVVGVGGTLTEWYGRSSQGGSTMIFPAYGLQMQAVADALESHPMLSLLCTPSRLYGEAPVSSAEIAGAVVQLGRLGCHCGAGGESKWLAREIEINPLVAADGRLIALDGVGQISLQVPAEAPRPLAKIERLLQPESAVVLGASASGPNPGRIILENLLRSEGVAPERLYAVHPKQEEIAGVPCFPTVVALPEKCDLAVVAIPAGGAYEAIRDLIAADRTESIILIPGGFAEAGETELARRIEDELQRAHATPGGGPVLVGGNCLGIVSRNNYNTFFLPEYKLPFRPGAGQNLAVVSQSGAYLVTFASNYDGLIHPRASISFGNQMDLTVSDFLEHFLTVPEVAVIACYVEGFRPGDGRRFVELARRAREMGRHVILYKAGRTEAGAQAAASHTASLAGDFAVAEACLGSAGVTLSDTLSRYEDLIKAFTLLSDRRAAGGRVGIISNAGFECSTVTDNLGALEPAVFDEATQAVLDEALPSFAHRTNPIDCTPMTGTEAFATSCRAILESPEVDVAILSSVPVTPALDNLPADPEGGHRENLAGPRSQASLMIEIIRGSSKPTVVVVDSGRIYDPMCRMIEAAGIPVFRKIDRAARALEAYCRAEGAVR